MKKIKCFIFLAFHFFILFVANGISSLLVINIWSEIADDSWKTYIHIFDDYDTETTSVIDFFNDNDSVYKLINTYEELSQNKLIDYEEILFQDIEIYGNYQGQEDTISGGGEFRNQNIDGGVITPIKSIQLSKKMFIQNALETTTEKQYKFEDNDYFFSAGKKVPVIVGREYKDLYKVGDEFRGAYLGRKNMKFVVRGILKNNTKMEFSGKEINLNSYIIFPALNAKQNIKVDKDYFYRILYLEKSEGYVSCKNKEEYKIAIRELNSISEKTGFKFAEQIIQSERNRKIPIILICGILVFCGSIFGYIFLRTYSEKKLKRIFGRNWKIGLFMLETLIISFLYMIVFFKKGYSHPLILLIINFFCIVNSIGIIYILKRCIKKYTTFLKKSEY